MAYNNIIWTFPGMRRNWNIDFTEVVGEEEDDATLQGFQIKNS